MTFICKDFCTLTSHLCAEITLINSARQRNPHQRARYFPKCGKRPTTYMYFRRLAF